MRRPLEIRNSITRGIAATVVGMLVGPCLIGIALSLGLPTGVAFGSLPLSIAATLMLYWTLSPVKEHGASWVAGTIVVIAVIGTLITLAWMFLVFLLTPVSGEGSTGPVQWLSADAIGKTMAILLFVWRRRRFRFNRISRGQCVGCGYNLTGNESGVCPECGTEIAE